MKTITILGGVAALALAGAAVAQSPGQDGQRGGRMDPNARVSQAEFVDRGVARLVRMDANGDGVVSREEMRAHREARMAERRDSMFQRMDANSDGSITRAEYDAAHEQRRARGAERAARRPEGVRGPGRHRAHHAGMRLDRGGQDVNIEQARQRATERFTRLDANSDGYVTGEEMRAAHEARRAERQAQREQRRAPAAE